MRSLERSSLLVALALPSFVNCSGGDTSRKVVSNEPGDGGPDGSATGGAGGKGGGGASGAGGRTTGGAGGASSGGGNGGVGSGGLPADAGTGGSSASGGSTDSGAGGGNGTGGTSANGGSANAGGTVSTGGNAGTGGTGGAVMDASTGLDASAPVCAVDGTDCSTAADAKAVCCGGSCIPGDCCVQKDCAGASDAGLTAVCQNHSCVDVAGSLSGLLWLLPCTSDLSSTVCTTTPTTSVSTTLGGAAGVTYDVSLRFRGVVEQKTYTGGCSDGATFLTSGADNGDSYNVYRLSVSSPPQTYFLNRGASNLTNTFVVDFEKTLRIDAGATVTLFAASVDNQEIKNVDPGLNPLSVPGASVQQPYDGQFIQMDVVSVTPDPYSAGSAGSGGYALAFDGSQTAWVPDHTELRPTTMTVESWFQFAGTNGIYQSVFGKPYGGGTEDSYTMWYQGGVLNAGAALSSPTGAATAPWTIVPGEWHHGAMVHDGAAQTTTLYVDGVPISCVAATATPNYDTHSFFIGGDVDNGSPNGFWYGALDEMRIFSTARTPNQIWSDMHSRKLGASTTGLVAEWTFDEGTGQFVVDDSGHGHDGILGSTNAPDATDPTWVTSTAPF